MISGGGGRRRNSSTFLHHLNLHQPGNLLRVKAFAKLSGGGRSHASFQVSLHGLLFTPQRADVDITAVIAIFNTLFSWRHECKSAIILQQSY
jgi:hypothetical protein